MTSDKQPDYNYLDSLNPQQREAVTYLDGPSLVIAGAGSGKTRVLTYKIVDLLAHGFEPWRILALTFTNKAAREMKQRVADVVGPNVSSKLWMGTFHSVFLRILREHADKLGYNHDFTIYDTSDSRSIIKLIVKEWGLDETAYKPNVIASVISRAKNALISPEQYIQDSTNYKIDSRAKRPRTGEVFHEYCRRCERANAMDFDDILFNMNVLLRDFPDVKAHYQDFFRYILVDEYQDTNFAQHLVVTQLAGERQNICVVGDDAQSIYSFRGANIDNILMLSERFPRLRTFKLEQNYRSTQTIINAAGSLIAKNSRQMSKQVFSENEVGRPIEIVRTDSDSQEGAVLASMISASKLSEHDSYDEYAVLYRTNAQSRAIEEKLRKHNIPYRLYGSKSFYQRAEIKQALAYFRLTVNPDDDEALRKCINYPRRGIGATTIQKLTNAAGERGVSLWQVLRNPGELNVNAGTAKKLEGFRQLIDAFISFNEAENDALQTANKIYVDTRILSVHEHERTPEAISTQENLRELLAAVKEFVDTHKDAPLERRKLSPFLSEISLLTDQDEKESEDSAKVTLMTVHASKGLEFKHVYISGLEEDLFPAALSLSSIGDLEEERRLLYVAITRAMKTCDITYASSRYRNGQTVFTRPSRFLRDIDPAYLKFSTVADKAPSLSDGFFDPSERYRSSYRSILDTEPRPSSGFSGFTPPKPQKSSPRAGASSGKIPLSSTARTVLPGAHSLDEVNVGTVIDHDKLGVGKITKIIDPEADPKILVDFKMGGERKLLLRFAIFKIVEQ